MPCIDGLMGRALLTTVVSAVFTAMAPVVVATMLTQTVAAQTQRPARAGEAPEIETITATREQSAAWADYELAFARHLMLANPERTYLGAVPAVLLAIPVLEIELEADGQVRHIRVKREPRQAKETVAIAIDAVRRAAPFPRVDHLPGPWVVQEVFLFNDQKRFRPRLLDR